MIFCALSTEDGRPRTIFPADKFILMVEVLCWRSWQEGGGSVSVAGTTHQHSGLFLPRIPSSLSLFSLPAKCANLTELWDRTERMIGQKLEMEDA